MDEDVDKPPKATPDLALREQLEAIEEAEPLARLRRRVERKALVVGAGATISALFWADLLAAFVLTVTWGVGIVCFRGLAVQVRNLSRTRSSGARFGVVRFATLAFALLLITRLGIASPAAFIVGLGVVPAALLLEVLHQLFEGEV